MKLTEFSVKHWQFTVVLFAMLAALGLTSLLSISRSEDPPLDFPTFTIVAVYPGASARDLERLVVKQIEDTLHGLDDVRSISSRIRPGVARIQVEFEPSEDADRKYDDVVREINALRTGLPAELARLEIYNASTMDVNIVQIALVSESASYRLLDSLAEDLEDRLSTVPGVRTAERWGAPERQVDVQLDLGRLAALRLPVGLVLGAIGGESADIPGGSVDAGTRSFSVRSSGSYVTLDQVRATVVRGVSGRLVRVGDIARRLGIRRPRRTGRASTAGVPCSSRRTSERHDRPDRAQRHLRRLDRFEQSSPRSVTSRAGSTRRPTLASPGAPRRRLPHRAGPRDAHAPAARVPRGVYRDDLDPPLSGDGRDGAALERLHAQPAHDRGHGDRARFARG
jgi:Cu/Ag efflux pump CusA